MELKRHLCTRLSNQPARLRLFSVTTEGRLTCETVKAAQPADNAERIRDDGRAPVSVGDVHTLCSSPRPLAVPLIQNNKCLFHVIYLFTHELRLEQLFQRARTHTHLSHTCVCIFSRQPSQLFAITHISPALSLSDPLLFFGSHWSYSDGTTAPAQRWQHVLLQQLDRVPLSLGFGLYSRAEGDVPEDLLMNYSWRCTLLFVQTADGKPGSLHVDRVCSLRLTII